MAHLTYTFKLLQTKGRKGKMLHEAMRRWTDVHTRFLDGCIGRVQEFEDACTVTSESGRTRHITRFLEKWVRQEIVNVEGFAQIESSVKDSLITQLGGQLMSFLELRGMQENLGFPTGRGHGDLDFEQYLDEFVYREWSEGLCDSEAAINLEYVTVQGKVQGYRSKAIYAPLEICRYDAAGKHRNYRLLRSGDGQLFALIFLVSAEKGSTPTKGDLKEVITGQVQKAVSSKAALFPLATSKWVMRKLDKWQPKASRLVYRDGEFYLHVAFETQQSDSKEWQTVLGVDMGKNRYASIAVINANGEEVLPRPPSVSGEHRDRIRNINAKVANAQARGGHYFYKYGRLNEQHAHTIANGIIATAKKHKAKVVVEDLDSMKKAMMAKSEKSNFNKGRKSNIYATLLGILEYKCALEGIELEKVDPWWTSQTCPGCGAIEPKNRLTVIEDGGRRKISRMHFRCVSCGYTDEDADGVAALNIARKSLFREVWTKDRQKNKTKKDSWQEFARTFCPG